MSVLYNVVQMDREYPARNYGRSLTSQPGAQKLKNLCHYFQDIYD